MSVSSHLQKTERIECKKKTKQKRVNSVNIESGKLGSTTIEIHVLSLLTTSLILN